MPVISFDEIRTHCVGTATISADIAFAPDSATLARAVDTELAEVAAGLRTCPADRAINAYGHAAEVPGGGDGVVLSRARAQAVLDRLVQLGVPARVIGTAVGYGNTSHQIVDNTPNGRFDEALARKNRVVELTVVTR